MSFFIEKSKSTEELAKSLRSCHDNQRRANLRRILFDQCFEVFYNKGIYYLASNEEPEWLIFPV